MDLFTRQHLNELLNNQDIPCLSIYIPTHRSAPEMAQDRIRFKNVLTQAHKRLERYDGEAGAIRKQLASLETWLGDASFWQHQSDGLAVFVSPESVWHFRLPESFEEQVRLNDHFFVLPLLTLLQSNRTFYLLAVSQNSCRLFVGNRDSISELHEANLPSDLRSALGWWREAELNLHSMQPKPATRGDNDTSMYHGHQKETLQNDLQAYFRKIDAGVTDALQGEKAPLVFAGVEYLFPLYADVNHYDALCQQAVHGNPDDLTPHELHGRAWDLVRPQYESRLKSILNEFRQRQSLGKATNDLEAVLTAARDGLVECLIVPRGMQLLGRFDTDHGDLHLGRSDDAEDLIDLAVLYTLKTSGEVLSIAPESMPSESKVIALLRAPLSAVMG